MFETASEPLKLQIFTKWITTNKKIFRFNRHINYKKHLDYKHVYIVIIAKDP